MRLGPVLLLLLALTGCGPTTVTATRPPPPTARPVTAVEPPVPALDLTLDELADALPHGVDLKPWTLDEKCLTRSADCGEYYGHPGVRVIVEGRRSVGIPEAAWVRAVAFGSPERAARVLDRSRHEVGAVVDGPFDINPTEPDENGDHTFGTTGTGALADGFRLGSWHGWRATARFTYQRLDGRRTTPVRYVEIVVVRDRYLVQANVRMYEPARAEPAAALAQRLAGDVITRLEGAPTS